MSKPPVVTDPNGNVKRKPTPKRYDRLRKQVAKPGVQRPEEEVALARVMRHKSLSRQDAKAYVRARTAAGLGVGGFTPGKTMRGKPIKEVQGGHAPVVPPVAGKKRPPIRKPVVSPVASSRRPGAA